MSKPSAAMLERAKELEPCVFLSVSDDDCYTPPIATNPCEPCKKARNIALALQAVADECAEIVEAKRFTTGVNAEGLPRVTTGLRFAAAIRARFGLQGER